MSSKLCKVSRIQKRKAFIDVHGKNDQIFIGHIMVSVTFDICKYFSLEIEYSEKLPQCDCLNALSSYNQ